MILFDSLNKRFLPSYGNEWIHAPNFKRLSERTVQFDSCFAGSLPCMPARRELHTGRYNFLHRSWGPLEPFDDSMPEILKNNGIYTHLISDHHLYWADGGATYHNRFSSWEIVRGQEGDPWKGEIKFPEIPEEAKAPGRLFLPSREKLADIWRQEWINRKENPVYKKNDLELWCKFLNKDFTEGRKKKIQEDFEKQKEYVTLGEYLYNTVEYDDVLKWQTDGFRKKFKKAADECGITYNVSCHSLRKTFGYISKIIHPGDPNALEILQDIYHHSSPAITSKYIGLSSKRKQMYFEDIGETILKAEQGDTEIRIDDSPVISFKQDDFRKVIKWVIEDNGHSDIEKLNIVLDMADKLRIKYL